MTKHNLREVFLFGLLAGLFGMVVALFTAVALYLGGWYPSPPLQTLAAIGFAFGVFFIATIYWLILWYLGERLGGRIGWWQAQPQWLRRLLETNRPPAPRE